MASTSRVIKLLVAPLAIALLAFLFFVVSAKAEHQSGKPEIGVRVSPERPIAGEETHFDVSVHKDHLPLNNTNVTVTSEKVGRAGSHSASDHKNMQVSATAKPTGQDGQYLASLKMPEEGQWKIVVAQGNSQAEFPLTVYAPEKRLHVEQKQDEGKGGNSQKGHDKPAAPETKGLHVAGLVAAYALTLSLDEHPRAGVGHTFVLTVADGKTGSPSTGLNVEIIPVHLPEAESNAHNGEADAGHPTDGAIPVLATRERTDLPGSYEFNYSFPHPGSHLLLVKTGPAQGEVAALPVAVEAADEHGADVGVPNYWFLGTLFAILAITIVTVALLRRREQAGQPVEVD